MPDRHWTSVNFVSNVSISSSWWLVTSIRSLFFTYFVPFLLSAIKLYHIHSKSYESLFNYAVLRVSLESEIARFLSLPSHAYFSRKRTVFKMTRRTERERESIKRSNTIYYIYEFGRKDST